MGRKGFGRIPWKCKNYRASAVSVSGVSPEASDSLHGFRNRVFNSPFFFLFLLPVFLSFFSLSLFLSFILLFLLLFFHSFFWRCLEQDINRPKITFVQLFFPFRGHVQFCPSLARKFLHFDAKRFSYQCEVRVHC